MNRTITNTLMPTVIRRTNEGKETSDIFSCLLNDRIIILQEEITDMTAASVTSQLLFLESQSQSSDITIYINSPGGSVSAGLAIYDVMQHVKPDVSTVCIGMAASMGAFLLAGGTKGKRYIMPNAEVMIHQPLGSAQGQATDINIAADHIRRTKERLNRILAQNTGQDIDMITKDTDRDNWLDAQQAYAYGLVDKII